MNEYQKALLQWSEMTGDKAPVVPEMPDEATRVLRCRLLLEETLEFIRASGCMVATWSDGRMTVQSRPDIHPPDLTAMAHENADVLYIAFGNAVAMGVDMGPVFAEVHAANLRKAGPDGALRKLSDGKVLKPAGWKPANVGAVLERLGEVTP